MHLGMRPCVRERERAEEKPLHITVPFRMIYRKFLYKLNEEYNHNDGVYLCCIVDNFHYLCLTGQDSNTHRNAAAVKQKLILQLINNIVLWCYR